MNLDISVGAFARAGVDVFTLVDTGTWYVMANFRETQLRHIPAGAPADIHLQSQPGKRFRGTVVGLGWAVLPENGTSVMGLPRVEKSIDWVRLAARFPVRIKVEDPDESFRVGASAVVTVGEKRCSPWGGTLSHEPARAPPAGGQSRSPLVEFLRRELAPTPGRFGATLRLTLACTAATVPIMIHHIPHGLVVMIVMYLITKEDTTATLLGSVLGLVGVTLGFVLALLAWQIALETAWRLAFVFLFAAVGLYIGRIVVLGALGTAIGLPAALAMVLPDILPVPDTEAMTEFVLWLWWCVALGLGVNLGVQLLLSPGDPLVLLRRALVERLRAVEEVARSLGGRGARGPRPPRSSLASLTVAGTSEMLTLLEDGRAPPRVGSATPSGARARSSA